MYCIAFEYVSKFLVSTPPSCKVRVFSRLSAGFLILTLHVVILGISTRSKTNLGVLSESKVQKWKIPLTSKGDCGKTKKKIENRCTESPRLMR